MYILQGMPMIITLKSYLARLEDEERFKPEGTQRKIPTVKELAAAAGVTPTQMQRIISGKRVSSLKLKVGGAIIKTLRKQGFPADVGDILEYRDDPPARNGHGTA